MVTLFTSILKMTIVPEKLTPEWLGVGDDEVNGFGVGGNSVEHAKKLEKLFKLRKSKSEKTSKF